MIIECSNTGRDIVVTQWFMYSVSLAFTSTDTKHLDAAVEAFFINYKCNAFAVEILKAEA